MLGVTNRSSFFCAITGVTLIAGAGIAYWYMSTGKTDDSTSHKTNEKPETSAHEVYVNKYYDKFHKLEDTDIEEAAVKCLKSNILYETTPKVGVIMFYDFEKESFCYYSDVKDVPYLYLETAARRYATVNKCKRIYVDMKAELLVATNMNKDKSTDNGLGIGTGTDDGIRSIVNKSEPFASFKSYNRKGTGGTKSTNLNKKFILRQNANRYSYMGRIKEFQMTNNAEYNKLKDPVTTMDYATFKKTILSAK